MFSQGCGLRQAQTGSLKSRVIDEHGNAIKDAQVYSLFAQANIVYTSSSGEFYLGEIPSGINNIIVVHSEYAVEETQVKIRPAEAKKLDYIRLANLKVPSRISNVKIESVEDERAVITFKTYKPVRCTIDYGTTRAYSKQYVEERADAVHSVTLENLEPETVYHFRIKFTDDDSITYFSYDYSFKTSYASIPPPPGNITVRPVTVPGEVEIIWEASPGGDVAGYKVYRKKWRGDWELLSDGVLGKTVRSFIDSSVEPGKHYSWAVVAVNKLKTTSEYSASNPFFVPGVVNSHQHITSDMSPIILTADLIISTGVNFSVDAGVEFLIARNDTSESGKDSERVEIIVNGRLELAGTQEKPVVFAPLDGAGKRDHWQGITIKSDRTGISDLRHVKMSGCKDWAIDVRTQRIRLNNLDIYYSENGLRLENLQSANEISESTFRDISQTAIEIINCRAVDFKDILIDGAVTGIRSLAESPHDRLEIRQTDIFVRDVGIKGVFGRARMINCLVVAPDGKGFRVDNALFENQTIINYCTIDANIGINIKAGSADVENNIIVNMQRRGHIGINDESLMTPVYEYNNVFGFENAYSGSGAGEGALEIDPLFEGGRDYSYRLQSQSLLRRADRFNSQMGRYGIYRF